MNIIKSNSLTISFVGFSDSNNRALDVYFSEHLNQKFAVKPIEQSQIHIIDMDGYQRNKNKNITDIINSPDTIALYVSNTPLKDVLFQIDKPLKIAELVSKLDEITKHIAALNSLSQTKEKNAKVESNKKTIKTKEMVEDKKATPQQAKKPEVGFNKNPSAHKKNLGRVNQTLDETKLWGVRWNTSKDISEPEVYIKKHYLHGHMIEAYLLANEASCPVKIETKFITIVILPKSRTAMVDQKDVRLRYACIQKMRRNKKEKRRDYIITKEPQSEEYWLKQPGFTEKNLEKLLWDIALWTSRGRLPSDIDINKTYKLKSWPNFTRLQSEGYMLCLTGILVQKSTSIIEISSHFNLSIGFICQFFSGVQALELLEQDDNTTMLNKNKKMLNQNSSSPNFFTRLFMKLAG